MSSVVVLVGLIVEMVRNTKRVSIVEYKGSILTMTVSKVVVGLV